MKKEFIGSRFDDFLKDEGILAESEAIAWKRLLAYQIEQEMKEKHISKTKLAQMMKTSRAAVNRLLDTNNPSLTISTLESAAIALGKRLEIRLANI